MRAAGGGAWGGAKAHGIRTLVTRPICAAAPPKRAATGTRNRMAPGHGRGQGFSQQGQLSAHTAGVETTGKQVRGRPLEQLAKDWRCQKQAPKTSPGGRAPAHVPASSGRPGFARIGATPACSGSRAGTALAARASRERRAASGGGVSSAREESPSRAARPGGDPPAKVRVTPCAACGTRGVRRAARPPSRSSRGARGPVWTRAAPSGTRPPGAQAVVLARPARAGRAGPRARVVSATPADVSRRARGAGRPPRTAGARFGIWTLAVSIHTSSSNPFFIHI